MDKLFGEFDRSSSYSNDKNSNYKNEHDHEIGYYMNLTDDTNSQLEFRSKGRVIEN